MTVAQGSTDDAATRLDALRALCAQSWTSGVVATEAADDDGRAVLDRLGLSDTSTER